MIGTLPQQSQSPVKVYKPKCIPFGKKVFLVAVGNGGVVGLEANVAQLLQFQGLAIGSILEKEDTGKNTEQKIPSFHFFSVEKEYLNFLSNIGFFRNP
jgi:hypothetical protein